MDRPSNEQTATLFYRLFRTALRLTGNVEDASDLVQQALCNAFDSWDDFDGRCLLATWVHRILINCVRDWARRRAVRKNLANFDEWAVTAIAAEPSADELLERDEQADQMRTALGQLPEILSRPFIAAVIDGHPYAEVAEMLSIPVGTVAYRVHRTRGLLRQTMQEDSPEVGP